MAVHSLLLKTLRNVKDAGLENQPYQRGKICFYVKKRPKVIQLPRYDID